TPAVSDPGQPIRLALAPVKSPAAAVAAATPVAAAPVPVAIVAPVSAPVVAPAPQIASAPAPAVHSAPVVADDPPFVEVPAPKSLAAAPLPATPVKAVRKAAPPVRAASFVPRRAPVRAAALPKANGNSTAVVQLGAYGSPQRVATAWNNAARRYSLLRAYMPVSARFTSAQGTFYRLSVKGFKNADQAKNLCISLRRVGGSCFVRGVAGDSSLQLAMR
ncbi:MAG: SPOR domain-containing protein, partial [Sphingomicrobium sp.]